MCIYRNAARDNVYNNENSFDTIFTWSIWTPEDCPDWVWHDGVYVAICLHRGGDARANYGTASLYRVDDSLGDSNFLDWVLGWHVEDCDTDITIDSLENLDDETALKIIENRSTNERLSERCSPGYASLPESELYEDCDTDNCYWLNGSALLLTEDGKWMLATPYHYSDAEISTPDNGYGWCCDAAIKTESFIENTIGEDILPGLLREDEDTPEWDNDDFIAELCKRDLEALNA